ncbi:MAG: IS110 family transposase [Dermatophilaceae bacterium]
MQVDPTQERLVERVAALDIGKAEVVCCVRVPAAGRGRGQEVRTFSTMTAGVLALAEWLSELGVTRVVMEATSDYWRPVFYVLEGCFEQTWLVNARDVKHLPGRPKTDRLDAVWLCRLAERDMLRPSFVPPPAIRVLRDLTRYRVDLVTARTAEKQRVEKLLEDAGIKLSVVASDIFGVSGRAMLQALIGGQRAPDVLADLARGRLRNKTGLLEQSFQGRFTEHHAYLLTIMLARIDALTRDIEALDSRIEAHVAPFAETVATVSAIPGLGPTNTAAILAEIGLDMTQFPTPAHLASWAKFSPATKESAGKARGRPTTGRGNRYLARALGEAAVMAGRGDSFLADRYRRIARRRGKPRAIVAVGRSMLIIIWHLLNDPTATYIDLGSDYYSSRIGHDRVLRRHIRELQSLGYHVTLTPAA